MFALQQAPRSVTRAIGHWASSKRVRLTESPQTLSSRARTCTLRSTVGAPTSGMARRNSGGGIASATCIMSRPSRGRWSTGRNHHVIVSSRRHESVAAVADAIRAAGGKASALACHVGETDSIDAAFALIEEAHGRLDTQLARERRERGAVSLSDLREHLRMRLPGDDVLDVGGDVGELSHGPDAPLDALAR